MAYVRDDPFAGVLRVAKVTDPTPGKPQPPAAGHAPPSPPQGQTFDGLDAADIEGVRAEVAMVVDDAVRFAEASPELTLEDAWRAFHRNHAGEELI